MNAPLSQFDLSGKVAVVTGGTGALGSVIARGLAEAGASVAIMGRNADRAEEVSRTIGAAAMAVPADVLAEEQLQAARDRILERHGRIDILVNAAGGNQPGATLARSEERRVGKECRCRGAPEEGRRNV